MTPLEVDAAAVEVFRAEKQDPKDYVLWRDTFNARREEYLALRQHPAPSAVKPAVNPTETAS
jgi:hypothetical protein